MSSRAKARRPGGMTSIRSAASRVAPSAARKSTTCPLFDNTPTGFRSASLVPQKRNSS
jgi:hypothetical protein